MLISEKRLKQIIREEVKKRYLLKEDASSEAWVKVTKMLGISEKPTEAEYNKAWDKWIDAHYEQRDPDKDPKAPELKSDQDVVAALSKIARLNRKGWSPYEKMSEFLQMYSSVEEKTPEATKPIQLSGENWDADVTLTFDEKGRIADNSEFDQLVDNVVDSLDWPIDDDDIKNVYDVYKVLRGKAMFDDVEEDTIHALKALGDRVADNKGDTIKDILEDDPLGPGEAPVEDEQMGRYSRKMAKEFEKFQATSGLGKAWKSVVSALNESYASERREKLKLILRHTIRHQNRTSKNSRLINEGLPPPVGGAAPPADDASGAPDVKDPGAKPGEQKPKKSGGRKSSGGGGWKSWTGWPMVIGYKVKGSKTNEVGKLQAKIKTKADGYFGTNSVKALKAAHKISSVDKAAYDKIMGGKKPDEKEDTTKGGGRNVGKDLDDGTQEGKPTGKSDVRGGAAIATGAAGQQKGVDKKGRIVYQATGLKGIKTPEWLPTGLKGLFTGNKIQRVRMWTLKPMSNSAPFIDDAHVAIVELDRVNYTKGKHGTDFIKILKWLRQQRIMDRMGKA